MKEKKNYFSAIVLILLLSFLTVGCGGGGGGDGAGGSGADQAGFATVGAMALFGQVTMNADGTVRATLLDCPKWVSNSTWSDVLAGGYEPILANSRCLVPGSQGLEISGNSVRGDFYLPADGENILLKIRFRDASGNELAPWLNVKDASIAPWVYKENGATYITAVYHTGDGGNAPYFTPGNGFFREPVVKSGSVYLKTYFASMGLDPEGGQLYYLTTADSVRWMKDVSLDLDFTNPWTKIAENIDGPTLFYLWAEDGASQYWLGSKSLFNERNAYFIKLSRVGGAEEYVLCVVPDPFGGIRPPEAKDAQEIIDIVNGDGNYVSVSFANGDVFNDGDDLDDAEILPPSGLVTVLDVSPFDGETDVDIVGTSIFIEFSHEVLRQSVADNVTITSTTGVFNFQLGESYNYDDVFELVAVGGFDPSASYTVTVGMDVEDFAGAGMAEPYTWTFQTAQYQVVNTHDLNFNIFWDVDAGYKPGADPVVVPEDGEDYYRLLKVVMAIDSRYVYKFTCDATATEGAGDVGIRMRNKDVYGVYDEKVVQDWNGKIVVYLQPDTTDPNGSLYLLFGRLVGTYTVANPQLTVMLRTE